MMRRLTFLQMLSFFLGVGAFVPRSSVHTHKTPTMAHLPANVGRESCSMLMGRGNTRNTTASRMGNNKKEDSVGFWENIKDKPGTLVVLPFVLLVGVDLLLNIAVLVKRTLDYFVLGQAPSSEPWW